MQLYLSTMPQHLWSYDHAVLYKLDYIITIIFLNSSKYTKNVSNISYKKREWSDQQSGSEIKQNCCATKRNLSGVRSYY